MCDGGNDAKLERLTMLLCCTYPVTAGARLDEQPYPDSTASQHLLAADECVAWVQGM